MDACFSTKLNASHFMMIKACFFSLNRYAFALEETNYRDRAEELCKEALSLQPQAVWATHTMSEIEEEGGVSELGLLSYVYCRSCD